MSKRGRLFLLAALMSAMALIAGGATATALQSLDREKPVGELDVANPEANPVQYSVKFVCGWLPPVPPDLEQWVKPGDYATSINIHNHTTGWVTGGARVALFFRAGTPPPAATAALPFSIPRRTTATIDCVWIWAALGVPPGSFVEGAVHIGLSQPLSVWAVYTSQTHDDPNAGPGPSAGISIDVEQVFPIQAPIG